MEASEKVAKELRELRRSVADLSGRLIRSGERRAGKAADAIEETSEEAVRHARSAADDLEQRLARLEGSVSRTVQEHPRAVAGSLIGLALVGVILAMLFNRKR